MKHETGVAPSLADCLLPCSALVVIVILFCFVFWLQKSQQTFWLAVALTVLGLLEPVIWV